MKKLFCDGMIYDSDTKSFVRADILTDDTKIVKIEEEIDIMLADEIVDCTGKYVIPGLVDVHTHGRTRYDFNTADADGVREMRKSYAAVGTTTVMSTLASAPLDDLYASIDAANVNREVESGLATIAGIHLEGRYLNPKRRGAHATELLKTPDAEELSKLLDRMMPAPAHVSAALELANDSFYKTVRDHGATLALVHSDATYDEAMTAIEKGAVSFTHTFNAMRPMHHREPGNIAASLLSDAYSELICDGEHVHPVMVSMLQRLKSDDKVILVTDSMEATGAEDGEYMIAGLQVFVKNGKAVNAEGALAGSTLNLIDALKNYMRFCSIPLERAVMAATVNPAKMLGIDNVCGQIKEGFRADFLILDSKDDVTLSAVYAAGGKVN